MLDSRNQQTGWIKREKAGNREQSAARRILRAAAGALAFCLFLCSFTACAEGMTLRTVSSFAGADPAAEAYVDILNTYEAQTGNTVSDASAPSDEAWKTSVLQDFAAGNEPDVLFFFAAGAASAPILSRVVPLSEINAACAGEPLPESEALREKDGQVYYEACLVLIQQPSADPNVFPDYIQMDGEYSVLINTDTGVVEDIFYDAALAGNG